MSINTNKEPVEPKLPTEEDLVLTATQQIIDGTKGHTNDKTIGCQKTLGADGHSKDTIGADGHTKDTIGADGHFHC